MKANELTPDDLTADDIARLGFLNFCEFSRTDATWQRTYDISEADGLLLWAGTSDFPAYANGAVRTDDALDAEEVVRRATDFFHERARGYTMFTRELPVDSALLTAAEVGGGMRIVENPQLVCHERVEERPLPDGVTLRWVTDAAGMTDFSTVNAAAYTTYGAPEESTASHFFRADEFTAPHVHSVLADLDGEPVGAAQILLSHGIAGVYWVGVVEAARGRGIADAVTRAVTNRGFDLGAANVQLQASEMGDPIYRRMGYEDVFRQIAWLMPGPA